MTTPPTGEGPQWRPAPDDRPTPPQQPGPERVGPWGAPGPGQSPYAAPGAPSYGPPGAVPQSPAYGQPALGPQPGYGQYGAQPPGWQPGPAPKPPRDRKRTALIAALVAVALAIAAGVALLVYVLSATILDRAAVERDVASQFEDKWEVALDLECRHRMIVRPGADYECEGTTPDGEEVEIRITITDENGAYTWAED